MFVATLSVYSIEQREKGPIMDVHARFSHIVADVKEDIIPLAKNKEERYCL